MIYEACVLKNYTIRSFAVNFVRIIKKIIGETNNGQTEEKHG
jgi:hypothetical protein